MSNAVKTETSTGAVAASNPSLSAGNRWSTRQICIMALFVALGVVLGLLQISILPMVPFLQLDIAAAPAIIIGIAFGPLAGCIVGALIFIIQGLLVGEFGGEIINILVVCAMVIPTALLLGRTRKAAAAKNPDKGSAAVANAPSSTGRMSRMTPSRIVLTYVISVALVAALGFIWNMTYTVWLYGMTQQAMLDTLIVWIVLFNVIKALVDVTVALLVYQAVRPLLENERGKKKAAR